MTDNERAIAVFKAKIEWAKEKRYPFISNEEVEACKLAIKALKQEPKTGHWIVHPKGIYAHLICDKCLSNAPYDCRTNYCPNCGRRMVEPEKEQNE